MTTYAYDALDQLLEVDDGSSAITYSYDALGRRSGRAVGTATETAHYGDLSDLPILDTGSSSVLRSWTYGPSGAATTAAAPMALVEQTSGAATQFPLTDAHGDVTTVSDDLGAVGTRQEFGPWGDHLSGPSLALGWLGAYGRRGDPAAGLGSGPLIQMGVRAYDPALGRFWSEDPVLGIAGLSQTLSRYPYAAGNPLNWYDLNGRVVTACGMTFGLIGCSDDDEPVNETEADPPKPDAVRYGPSAEGACGVAVGPVGLSAVYGQNQDGSTYDELGFYVTRSLSLSAGCAVMGWSGRHDGGGAALTACAFLCIGVSTDQGLGFGFGPTLGIEYSPGEAGIIPLA